MFPLFRRGVARGARMVGAAVALAWVVSACAGGASGVGEAWNGAGSGQPSQEQIDAALRAQLFEREDFDPSVCSRAEEGAFVATLQRQRFHIPLELFLAARPDARFEAGARSGCPEAPYRARAVSMSGGALVSPSTGLAPSSDALRVTLIGPERAQAMMRRSDRVWSLLQDDLCAPSADPAFFACETTERVFSEVRAAIYFIAVTAEAPALDRAPFAIRCLDVPAARRCSVVDALAGGALVAIDFDPDVTPITDIIEIHRQAMAFVASLERGFST